MISPHRLLCCALAVILSSTGVAKEPLPLNELGELIYVRFKADYTPVGQNEEGWGRFKKGEVAMVTKIVDANYFAVARPPLDLHSINEFMTIPESLKEFWIEHPKYPDPQSVLRSKVDVISESDAMKQAVSLAMSNMAVKRGSAKFQREIAAERAESEARREASYPKSLFMGWNEKGNPVIGKHQGGGNYFAGWDTNGNPRNIRATQNRDGTYFMGWDEHGNPVIGR
jgi:hypothetical protein